LIAAVLVALIAGGTVAGLASGGGSRGSSPTTAPASSSSVTTAPVSPENPPAGYSVHDDPVAGYSIALPARWKQIDPGSPGAPAQLAQIEKQFPRLAAAIGDPARLASQGMKLLAVDPSGTGDYASNINVVVKTGTGISAGDFGQLAGQLPAEYQKLGATYQGSSRIELNGHPSLVARGVIATPGGTGTVEVPEQQYFFVDGGSLFIITLSGSSPDLSAIVHAFAFSRT
jgi:hypothetical protein